MRVVFLASVLACAGCAESVSTQVTVLEPLVFTGTIDLSGQGIGFLISYAKINMSLGSEKRWFCTSDEAEAAGWRRAVR